MGKLAWTAAAALMVTGGAASANVFNGAAPITHGDLRTAEREIVAQRALYPDQIDLMMNLATVYIRTGRPAEARRIWTAVAAQPDQEVVLNGGASVWSHQLAARALRVLPVQVASR